MNKRVHALYLSYDGLTDPLGQSQILPYLIELSKKGLAFTLISFEKENLFKIRRKEIENLCHQNQINWVPLRYHKRPPVLSTLYDIFILWFAAKKIYTIEKFQVVHCRSYITSLVGLRMKLKWGVKFIFDMRGFWVDERVEGGLWNLKNPVFSLVYKFFKKKEKQFLQASDGIVSLTNNAKQEILSWNITSTQITVIPTCVDLKLFDPSKISSDDQEKLRDNLGLKKDDFILLYLGSWGTWYLTDEMLEYFSRLKKQKPNAKFLIVSGDRIDLESYSLKDDVIHTVASRNLVPLYISICNSAVCFIKPAFSKKASSATKLGEILAMNVPVVTNEGWGDVDEMTKASVITLDRGEVVATSQLSSANLREYCAENLSLIEGANRYFELYKSVVPF